MTDPKPEPAGYNTPVDDPHHYDFENVDVPLDPDEDTPPAHEQHEGGYRGRA